MRGILSLFLGSLLCKHSGTQKLEKENIMNLKPVLITVVIAAASFVGGLAIASSSLSATEPSAADRATIETVVADYIRKNGKALIDSINAYSIEEQMAQAKGLVADHNPTFGPEDAKVTIIEFSEFQCPFCRRVQDTLANLRDKYKNQVRFVYKHYPLPFHPEAEPSAIAAQAAHNQGKFWEYSEKLWENQANLSAKLYTEVAEELGLDMEKFNADLKDEKTAQVVAKDLEDGQAAGASGTPYFLINGQGVSGALPQDVFEQAIEQVLEEAK